LQYSSAFSSEIAKYASTPQQQPTPKSKRTTSFILGSEIDKLKLHNDVKIVIYYSTMLRMSSLLDARICNLQGKMILCIYDQLSLA